MRVEPIALLRDNYFNLEPFAIELRLTNTQVVKMAFATTEDGIQIQYATSEYWEPSIPPLIFVPGMLGIIDFYDRELLEFGPRQVVTFSHRGLGTRDTID